MSDEHFIMCGISKCSPRSAASERGAGVCFFCAGGGFVISDLPVFYGGVCAPRQGENGICGCRHDPFCRVSCAGGSDAGNRILLLLQRRQLLSGRRRGLRIRVYCDLLFAGSSDCRAAA